MKSFHIAHKRFWTILFWFVVGNVITALAGYLTANPIPGAQPYIGAVIAAVLMGAIKGIKEKQKDAEELPND